MKKLFLVAFWTVLSFSGFAYQAQFGLSEVGDYKLEAIGKCRFSNFMEVNLAPTNAPSTNGVYTVRCQVIYTDSADEGPIVTDFQRWGLRLTGDWLLDQLKDFISENYVGAEFDDLLGKFYAGAVGVDLNERFPLVIKEKMADAGLNLDVVRIQVLAEADLLRALRVQQVKDALEY